MGARLGVAQRLQVVRRYLRGGIPFLPAVVVGVLALVTFWAGPRVFAALSAVGPVVPVPGTAPAVSFPLWYRDSNGLALQLCLDGTASCAGSSSADMDPANPNAAGEAFWWSAEANMDVGSGGSALIVLAMEAAFATPAPDGFPQTGQEISFGRVRFRVVSGLEPDTDYAVVHPFGTATIHTTAAGDAPVNQNTTDIGCEVVPCDFSLALGSGIGPFLVWDPAFPPAPPAGFIGNPAVDHKVIGSPLGTNFFRITGPNAGGPGVNTAETDLFSVQGKLTIAAVNDTARVPARASGVPINVLANDISPVPVVVSSLTQPVRGASAVAAGGGWVTYSNNAGTADSFTYVASDVAGNITGTATVNVTIHAANAAPVAAGDAVTVTFNSSNNVINVRANDSDADNDLIFVRSVTQPVSGTVVTGTAGLNVSYTPDPGFFGPSHFTYTLSDGLATSVATVTVNVNRAPVAQNDVAMVNAGTTNNVVNVLANDSDPDGNPIAVSAVAQGSTGAVAIGGGGANVLYTPGPDSGGVDSFTYTLTDSILTSTATVSVMVNRLPVAATDAVTVARNTGFMPINVLANDSDPDGNPVTLTAATQPSFGATALGPGGLSVLYSPRLGFVGADSFIYTISDGFATATGTVNVIIPDQRASNSPPVAVGDSATVFRGSAANQISVLANDSDPDGDAVRVTGAGGASRGDVAVGPGGAVVLYSPLPLFSGTDSFTYTISDGLASATANVAINILANRPPAAVDDSFNVPQGSAGSSLNVLANDSDPDGNALAVVDVASPVGGTAAIGPGAAVVVYTPGPGFSGADSFTYTVFDGSVFASATVTVSVHAVNKPPVAANDTGTVPQVIANTSIDVLANDSDPDGDPIALSAVTQGTHGTVAIAPGSGRVLYSPNPGFGGIDSFTYTVTDGALTSTGSVLLNVQGRLFFLPILPNLVAGGW